jgi:GTP cyclohydrolase II
LYVFSRTRNSLLGRLAGTRAPTAASLQSRLRDFGLGAQVLAHLGVHKIRLLTNNPRRIVGVGGYGLHIVECLPIRAPKNVIPLEKEA